MVNFKVFHNTDGRISIDVVSIYSVKNCLVAAVLLIKNAPLLKLEKRT